VHHSPEWPTANLDAVTQGQTRPGREFVSAKPLPWRGCTKRVNTEARRGVHAAAAGEQGRCRPECASTSTDPISERRRRDKAREAGRRVAGEKREDMNRIKIGESDPFQFYYLGMGDLVTRRTGLKGLERTVCGGTFGLFPRRKSKLEVRQE
jgi:hypothetical protein